MDLWVVINHGVAEFDTMVVLWRTNNHHVELGDTVVLKIRGTRPGHGRLGETQLRRGYGRIVNIGSAAASSASHEQASTSPASTRCTD